MATKYVSALDGGQMDSALMDMATHASEAWAVGTRNGQAVSSGDVTYHNNAKYYSDKVSTDTDRAEDAAARAEAAVPSGTAGAVFFNTAQSLTETQKGQAKANIGAGSTNPNLLDNPWFIVNQRGNTTATSGAYFADRWKVSNSTLVTATRNSNGTITFTKTAGTTSVFIQQYIDAANKLDEEAFYTVSLMDENGGVYSVTEKFVTGTQSELPVTINGLRVAIGLYGKGVQLWLGLYLRPADEGSFTLKAVKLELGSVSTLANDVPPNYAEELAKCQRYFIKFTLGGDVIVRIAGTPTSASAMLPLPVTMRGTTATVATTAAGSIVVNNSLVSVTSLGASATIMPNGASVSLTIPSGQTARDIGTWFNYSCTLSCDL